jgi:NAD(P)-dependent dehydrogenase (short-subunit alcohol dehydrogenase family)
VTITLITGANKGLGYATARRLSKDGHTVYVGARNAERGEKAAANSVPGSCRSTSPTTHRCKPLCG